MGKRSKGTRFSGRTLVALLVGFCLIGGVLTVISQDKPFVEKVLGMLTRVPEDDLAAMSELVADLDYDPETESADDALLQRREAFFGNSRNYMLDEWGIGLSPNVIRIYAIDTTVPANNEGSPWFRIDRPLEGLHKDPRSIAWFGNHVAVVVSRAYDPQDEEDAERSPDPTEAFLDTVTVITVEALDRLEEIMNRLDQPEMENAKLAFLEGPRAKLVDLGLALPASSFEVIAIDLDEGREVGAINIDRERAGLGRYKEGISIVGETLLIGLVEAI
jgi:hypothetical protein